MDPSDLLSAGFYTLNLQSESTGAKSADNVSLQKVAQFTIFGELPIELRLKIFERALPSSETIHVTSNIILADSDFGLYLNFSITSPAKATATHVFGSPTTTAPAGWYKKRRCLALLSVNKECRNVYLENLPFKLPTGPFGQCYEGKIRYMPTETIHITNFDMLFFDGKISQAIENGWLLQQLFNEVETLMVPIRWILTGTEEPLWKAKIIKGFKNLKLLKAKMWDGFGEDMAEDVRQQITKGMISELGNVENKLKEWKEEKKDVQYQVPKFKLEI